MKVDVILGITSAIGLTHALLFGLLVVKSPKGDHLSNYLLTALLLSFAVRIFKSTFYAVAGYVPEWLPAIGLIAMSFNGPLLLSYADRLKRLPPNRLTLAYVAGILLATSTLFIHQDAYMRIIYLVIIIANFGYGILSLSKLTGIARTEVKQWLVCVIIGFFLIDAVYLSQWTHLPALSYVIATALSSLVLMTLVYLGVLKYNILRKVHHSLDTTHSAEEAALSASLYKLVVTDQQFRQRELTLLGLAKTLGVSPAKVSASFQKEFNASFPDFINQLRLNYVADRLREPDNTDKIEMIAYDAGFSSASNFYARFKKNFGMTPVAYRSKALGVLQE